MNAFYSLICLVLLFAFGKSQCPGTTPNLGPCVGLLCPTGSTCVSNVCCADSVASTCVDFQSDCAQNVAQCTVDSYRVFMTTNCPKTCGRCGVTGCTDSHTKCTEWASVGFCRSSFYDTATKQLHCRATCGFC